MNNKALHILVVDDDDRIRELVKEYLEENNFIVTTARNVQDAKIKLNIIKFDILILDIMMPGESGLSLTKEIKKNNHTPVILLTARGEAENRIEGLETGADDYLAKPFEPRELVLRIKNILQKTKNKIQKSKLFLLFSPIGSISTTANTYDIFLNSSLNEFNSFSDIGPQY